jgi:hypothetical protein
MIRRLFALTLLALAAVSGCAGRTPVDGTVTLDGKPLAGAAIRLEPASGPMAIGISGEGGKFTLNTDGKPGAYPGEYTVFVQKPLTTGAGPDKKKIDIGSEEYKKMMEGEGPGAGMHPDNAKLIKYAPGKSSYKVKVAAGTPLTLELTSK